MVSRSLAAGVLLFFASFASAQDGGQPRKWYVDVGVGESTLNHEGGFTSIDDTDTSYSLRVGYRFTRFFAVEAGYIDLGDFRSEFTPPCGNVSPCPSVIHEGSSIDGYVLNNRFIWPVAQHFQLNGSVGLLYSELTSRLGNSPNALNDTRANRSNIGLTFGIGAAVPINERVEIGLDWMQYSGLEVPFDFTDEPSISDNQDTRVLSLNLRVLF